MSKEITLREFASDMSLAVNAFFLYWRQQSKRATEENKEMWPDKMPLEEWQEQFFSHLQSKGEYMETQEQIEEITRLANTTPEREHAWHTCNKLGCMICEGGLAMCTICGQAERTLEKFCPGKQQKETIT